MSIESATQSTNQLGRPLGTGRDWRHRLLLHHVPLALASAMLFILFMGVTTAGHQMNMFDESPIPRAAAPIEGGGGQSASFSLGFELGGRAFMAKSTTATGYVATGLLMLTLLVGPANLLLRRRNPVSTSLARDTGTWATIASIVHVVVGLQVHANPDNAFNFLVYFFADGVPRTNSFGLGNWTGLAALVIAVGLLALSNDRSLRELKAKRWKNLQRLNYALFALVVLHAIFYGALLRMTSPFTLLLIFTVIAALVGQAVGIWLWRRRYAHNGDLREQEPGQPAGATR